MELLPKGFGSFDDKHANVATDIRKSYRLGNHDQSGTVFAGRRVMIKPSIGLVNQERLIPLRYCPIHVGLEFVNNGADAVFVDTTSAENIRQIVMLVIYNVSVTF